MRLKSDIGSCKFSNSRLAEVHDNASIFSVLNLNSDFRNIDFVVLLIYIYVFTG